MNSVAFSLSYISRSFHLIHFFELRHKWKKRVTFPKAKKKYLVCYCEYSRKQTEIILVADTIRKGSGVKTTLQFEIWNDYIIFTKIIHSMTFMYTPLDKSNYTCLKAFYTSRSPTPYVIILEHPELNLPCSLVKWCVLFDSSDNCTWVLSTSVLICFTAAVVQ